MTAAVATQQAVAAPASHGARRRIAFLDWLRAAASLLVVWDHLVAEWLNDHGRSWLPLRLVQNYVNVPFSVNQDFGWLGVVTFFLISGFIISSVSVTESTFAFVVKRVLRIFPPLAAAVLTIVALTSLDHGVAITPSNQVTVGSVLWNLTLINYLRLPQIVLVGVGWTLAIEVAFYTAMALVARFLRGRWPLLTPVLLLATAAWFLVTAKQFGGSYFLLAITVSYVPLLVLGQLIWLRWLDRVGWIPFFALSIGAWLLFAESLWRFQPRFVSPAQAYGPSVLLAYAVFAFMLSKNSTIRTPRVVRYLAERGYSLYLFHWPVGRLVLDHLYGRAPFTVVISVTVAVILLVVEVVYRCVERPSQRLARHLLSGTRRAKASLVPADA